MANNFLNQLEALPLNSRVCLFGAGDGGENFKRILERERSDVKLISFLDDFKSGERDGLKIVQLNDLGSLSGKFDLILITSAFWKEMQKRLVKLKIRNFRIVNPFLFYEYLIFSEEEWKEYSPQLRKAQALLKYAEDRSLYGYLAEIRRINLKETEHLYEYFRNRQLDRSRQYLEFINKKKIHTIIEGGVFDGSNTVEFIKFLPSDGFIYGFDPLYPSLENENKNFLNKFSNVRIYPEALWSRRETLNFCENKDNKEGSKIVDSPETQTDFKHIPAVSIDEFVSEERIDKIDFIKLDVEGAELDILKGAENTLKTSRPQLAISIYHQKEDLFGIPLYLDKVLEGYCYRIQHYSSTFWDTVWYALPNEE